MTQVLTPLAADWDSYGAPAISQETIDAARAALKAILPVGVPWPDEVPTSDGGVQFEWQYYAFHYEVEVGKSLFAYYLDVERDILADDDWDEGTPAKLAPLLKEHICIG